MKKQTFEAFAVVSRRGWLHHQVGAGALLFDRFRDAKFWIEVEGDRIEKVRVTVEPVKKPKRARKRPSKWTVRMGEPVPNTEWLQIAEPKTKRARKPK